MSWAKDSSGAAKMINARSETAATKPAFRDALKSRRCLPESVDREIRGVEWDKYAVDGNI